MDDLRGVNRALRLLRALKLYERRIYRRSVDSDRERKLTWYFFYSLIAPLLTALVLVAAYYFYPKQWLASLSLLALLLEYLAALSYPFVSLFIHIKAIKETLGDPIGTVLGNISARAHIDSRYLGKLSTHPIKELQFLRMEVESERNELEKRVRLVSDSIEKVGLLPGLLAVAVVLVRLGSQQPDWIYAVAYAIPVLYVAAAMMHLIIMWLDRYIGVIDFIIKSKV